MGLLRYLLSLALTFFRVTYNLKVVQTVVLDSNFQSLFVSFTLRNPPSRRNAAQPHGARLGIMVPWTWTNSQAKHNIQAQKSKKKEKIALLTVEAAVQQCRRAHRESTAEPFSSFSPSPLSLEFFNIPSSSFQSNPHPPVPCPAPPYLTHICAS